MKSESHKWLWTFNVGDERIAIGGLRGVTYKGNGQGHNYIKM